MLQRKIYFHSLLFVFLLSGFSSIAKGQNSPYMQYTIKHIADFASYTTWPTLANEGFFTIGIVDDKQYYQAVTEHYKEKKIKGKPVKTVLFSPNESKFSADLLYIPSKVKEKEAIYTKTRLQPILTICEGNDFENFQIRLFSLNQEIVYELNPRAYNTAKLEVDYYFLRMSRVIK